MLLSKEDIELHKLYLTSNGSKGVPANIANRYFVNSVFTYEDWAYFTFNKCTFINIRFTGLVSTRCRFFDCKFKNCTFENCDLAKALFAGCEIADTEYLKSSLVEAQFLKCTFDKIQINNSITMALRFANVQSDYDSKSTIDNLPKIYRIYFDNTKLYEIIKIYLDRSEGDETDETYCND